jgi:hypothetical protein
VNLPADDQLDLITAAGWISSWAPLSSFEQ